MDRASFEKLCSEVAAPRLASPPIGHQPEVDHSIKSCKKSRYPDDVGLWHDISVHAGEHPLNNEQFDSEIKLKRAMHLSSLTTSKLQEWDRDNGLPKSHSQTMVNSSRSREQLQSGMVLQKWNGSPLLLLPGVKVRVRRRTFRGENVVGLS